MTNSDSLHDDVPQTNEVDYDFPEAREGKSVVITTNRSIHVRIMDDQNYQLYRNDQDCRAFQGKISSSPYRFKIPHGQHWHVVVNPYTIGGLAQFTVRLIDDAVLS